MNKAILIIMALLASAGLTWATTITVGPEAGYDFATIQAGIDASVDGDTVLVAPGEYVITEPITFQGNAITVISETGPDETTIRMGTPTDTNRGSVVIFENNETDASVLQGFTITGGRGSVPEDSFWGGGIFFKASSGTVSNCAIVQNKPEGSGGGVMVYSGSSATLIGCIISENLSPVEGYGGGVCCAFDSSASITDCTITTNTATGGGGVFCAFDSNANLNDCLVMGNTAVEGGGGVRSDRNSALTVTNCNIAYNSTGKGGGAMFSWNKSSLTVTDCIMIGNTAGTVGGVLECLQGCSATFYNCIITYNAAALGGGGLASVYPGTFVAVNNCTIWGNSAGSDWGGGGVGCYLGSSTAVTNSILWGNTSPKGDQIAVTRGNSALTVAYSNVDGGQAAAHVESGNTLNWGKGNIDADPLFAELGYWADNNDPNIVVEPDDPNAVWIDGDYHLKSEAGRWDPISESWLLDAVTSPCIDRGDPNSPVGEEPDPNGGIVNMGAYGGTPEASMSIGQLSSLSIPLAYWMLDETYGHIAYDSIGRNDGICHGEPVWRLTDGQVGGALEFDGVDDYVETDFVLDPADGAFSVVAWIQGGAPGQVIISQINGDSAGETWLGTDAIGGNLMTGLVPQKIGWVAPKPLLSEFFVTDGQWHYVGFVWDGSYRALYVDGIEIAKDATVQNPLRSATGSLYFGADKTLSLASFFSGLIDDVRIYTKALSADEIAALAQ